jgi:hypothetical protein
MENRRFRDVIGNAAAPFETNLAGQCATASDYFNIGDPQHPDYLAATSGQRPLLHGASPRGNKPLRIDNVFRQVRAHALTERSYEESMRRPCQLQAFGPYTALHNPAAYYVGADDRSACRADDVPLGTPTAGRLVHDLQTDNLPSFSFVTPNRCNDTHDCSVQTGDQWLARWIPMILDSAAYRAGGTALFIVWDEYSPMPLIVVSPSITVGTVLSRPLNHYSLLRTTEELLGLPLLGRARTTPSMRLDLHL